MAKKPAKQHALLILLLLFRTDPNTKQILESMRAGAINIKQAAEALGMEPAMLAYQLAGKVSGGDTNGAGEDQGDEEEHLMEVSCTQ